MERYGLNIETCCLYVKKNKIKFGQKFFYPQKYAFPYTYDGTYWKYPIEH